MNVNMKCTNLDLKIKLVLLIEQEAIQLSRMIIANNFIFIVYRRPIF